MDMNRLLFFSVLLAIVGIAFGCEDGSGEITVYPVDCSEQFKYNKCSGHWYTLNRTTYKVLVEQQQVIYWMPGFDFYPVGLRNCAVRDRENWNCEYPDGSTRLYMVGGSFHEESREGNKTSVTETEIRYVSFWRWWRLQLGLSKEI
jgi:hypothetical protein